jgi:hypothetical protein
MVLRMREKLGVIAGSRAKKAGLKHNVAFLGNLIRGLRLLML